MATKISLLPSAVAGNLTGATKMPATDASNVTTGPTLAQLRTAIFAQGTGYATTDPLVVGGTLTVTGAATIQTLTVGLGGGAVATNTAVGTGVLAFNTTGHENAGFGTSALSANTIGNYNFAGGMFALLNNISGDGNTAAGYAALYTATTGNFNTAVGFSALNQITTGSRSVGLGMDAGKYATTSSDEFFVNNQDRGTYANDKALSLLYGTFGATVAAQTLQINAACAINGKTPVANVAAPTAAGASYGATEQALLNDIRTRLINFGIYT